MFRNLYSLYFFFALAGTSIEKLSLLIPSLLGHPEAHQEQEFGTMVCGQGVLLGGGPRCARCVMKAIFNAILDPK